METGPRSVKVIIGQSRLPIVLLFQRPYAWNQEDQWKPPWHDIPTLANRLADGSDARSLFLRPVLLDQVGRPMGIESGEASQVRHRFALSFPWALGASRTVPRWRNCVRLFIGASHNSEHASRSFPANWVPVFSGPGSGSRKIPLWPLFLSWQPQAGRDGTAGRRPLPSLRGRADMNPEMIPARVWPSAPPIDRLYCLVPRTKLMALTDAKAVVDAVSLVASIASLILSVLAIWLAFKFYELSKESAEAATNASNDVSSTVARLEKVFQMQYSDTFSMVRDTYTDFRRHLLADSEASARSEQLAETHASAKAKTLKDEATNQVTRILATAATGPAPRSSAQHEINAIVTDVIDRSLAVNREARDEAVKEQIVEYLLATSGPNTRWRVGAVVSRFRERFQLSAIVKSLYDLHRSNVIALNGQFSDWVEIGPETTFLAPHLSNQKPASPMHSASREVEG